MPITPSLVQDERAGNGPAEFSAAARYAVYFAPPAGSPWWVLGSRCLGRDAITGAVFEEANARLLPTVCMNRNVARYGFHMTLKAPFRLAEGCVASDVHAQAMALVRRMKPVSLMPLRLSDHRGFVALWPVANHDAIAEIAGQCVEEFDSLRAALAPAEIARRTSAGLTGRQSALLARWGYPHVFEQFEPHFSLSDALPADELAEVISCLSPQVDALQDIPLILDALVLFVADDGVNFRVTRRYAFDGAVTVYG